MWTLKEFAIQMRQGLRVVKESSESAEKIISGLRLVTTADPLSKIQGAVSLLDGLGHLVLDGKGNFAQERGYTEPINISGSILKMLLVNEPHTRKIVDGYVWKIYDNKLVVRCYMNETLLTPIWCKDKQAAYAYLYKLFWQTNHRLLLTSSKDIEDETLYHLEALRPATEAYGSPTPQDVAELLTRRPNGGRLLIIGPTGSGKTSLANQAVEHISLDNSHNLLKIHRDVIEEFSPKDISYILQIAKPSVLLLDDVQRHITELLETLEIIDSKYIILTLMDDSTERRSGTPGSLYYPGFRPGRIDEIIYVGLPDGKKRAIILNKYLGYEPTAKIIESTEGLSGAYLKELASRILTNRCTTEEEILAEVTKLKLCSPPTT